MVQILPQNDSWAQFGRDLAGGATQGYMQRADQNALQKAILGLGENPSATDLVRAITGVKTYHPESKQELIKNYLGAENLNVAREKAVNAKKSLTPDELEQSYNNYIAAGYPDYQARIMTDPTTPPGVKQQIAQEHKDLTARGIRMAPELKEIAAVEGLSPSEPTPPTNAEKAPEAKETLPTAEVIEQVEVVEPKPKKEEWPKVSPPPATTYAEKEKWRDKNQRENNKLLKEVKGKSQAHNHALIRYNRLNSLNNTGKIPEGMGRLVINPETGEPYGAASLLGLVNKETQDFVKTVNDFLIDAKTYFGSRVTNFDISAFKSRLPTLLNTEDGRRLIINQMKLMEELQQVHDSELEAALKHYGGNASYSDVQRIVDEKTSAKEEAIIQKLNDLDSASHWMDIMAAKPDKYKDTTLIKKGNEFRAVPNAKLDEAIKRGWVKW